MDLGEPLANSSCIPPGGQRSKPGMAELLRALALDMSFDRGRGDFVYGTDEHGNETEVLDLVSGYGTLLLGHNHPALVCEATRLLSIGRPNHVQGSRRELAQKLADELARRTGRDDCVVFANSGAEAVEAAIKHALLETNGRTFLALEGAFHGKTTGALQLAGNRTFREPFAVSGFNVVRIRPNDLQQLEATFDEISDLAGFVFEPILGEGGVRPLSPAFAQRIVELCRTRNIPSIADECQTGLARTGSFLASHSLGIHPDYVILSKALGGGLAKISALLIDRRRYRSAFDLLQTSTFAEDDFSSGVALKTLECIDPPLMEMCRKKGSWLLDRLNQLRDKYPGVIADVRGSGLMLGIELRDQSEAESFLLRQLHTRQLLGVFVAGHLLRTHRIRVAPTLSEPCTLRVQPSALISQSSLDRFIDALSETCLLLAKQDVIRLTLHLRGGDRPAATTSLAWPLQSAETMFHPAKSEARRTRATSFSFAWLFHLIDADDVQYMEPAVADFPVGQREAFLDRLVPLAEPIVMPRAEIRSATGSSIGLWPILLPVTSAWLKQQIERRRLDELNRLLRRSLEVAESLGANLVSLGQFTSIVSSNGRSLTGGRIGLTTGNSYTTALIVEAIGLAQTERGVAPESSTLAVVGAAGNIGRACAEIMAAGYRRVILVGPNRPSSRQQLQGLADRIEGASASCDLASVLAADVVVCATNCVEPVLGPSHLRQGAIVCDASIPHTVRPETRQARPDVTVIRGGIVRLPNREQLNIPGLPLPPGHAFGCLAEGAILCFEGVRDASYTGRLCPEKIARITQLAARHGFGSPCMSARYLVADEER